MKIFPSLISANLLNLQATIDMIDPYVDGYHLDIMDAHFVPNLTWGPAFINALRVVTAKPFQVHLMVDNPLAWIDLLDKKEGDSFVFHAEAVTLTVIHRVLDAAKKAGWRIGLALNPATQVEMLGQHLGMLDEVLIMSVNPGFSGQSFIDTTHKCGQITSLCEKIKVPKPLICMDGGINHANIKPLIEAGVDIVGAASAIFNGDPLKNITALRSIITPENNC